MPTPGPSDPDDTTDPVDDEHQLLMDLIQREIDDQPEAERHAYD